ncbi:PIN domain-containing protein [Pyrofollis japonicus]|uniref:type II toxin-antitoxin system VapC family toxin n=1 Tax=Pyrofollis japonicus TaxID=3060460 RepID=UPI00295A5975|nr:type II toxin-antitoxin system VapC family toxin [Pyrofollis japonicus]BEP17816.1 PIN domain-containing protein [Pyrofollis japonicus]
MIYVDTNVIISYMDELDPNHSKAVKLLEAVNDKRVVSKLTLVELASVYSRAGLEAPLSLAIYSIESIGARIGELDFDEVLLQASRLADALKLRTLDLLHIVSCRLLGAERFATFDKDIVAKRELILRELGIRVETL